MPMIHTLPARRELAYRSSGGTDIFLLWCAADDSLAVVVVDATGGSFELVVDGAEAIDVFEHPYAHAALRGLAFGDTALEVAA